MNLKLIILFINVGSKMISTNNYSVVIEHKIIIIFTLQALRYSYDTTIQSVVQYKLQIKIKD